MAFDMKLLDAIQSKIDENWLLPEPYRDMFEALRLLEEEDFDDAHKRNDALRIKITKAIRECDPQYCDIFYEQYKRCLLFDAPHFLDAYLLYLEIDRPPKDRFYQPRRRIMKQVVDALQALVDDELDEVFLSMPPRVGKTTLIMFFETWLIGRDPERSNLYSAYSDTITNAFYQGILELINDPHTYKWADVFPGCKIADKNKQLETLNINRSKRYPSLTCRSLYGTLNGACDCNGFLISDDLIGGIEEALNKDRMVAAWTKVDNNLLTRAKEHAKILWCGTRWSMIDPIGVRMDLLVNDENYKDVRYKIINLPALDENDESNFDYDYGVGFSTDYYRRKRASFERNADMASWNAQYLQEPIEREGALFEADGFKYYDGELPPVEELSRIFMPIDPAFGGGDFVAAPIVYQFGDEGFVHDVVYSDCDKSITIPLLATKIIRHRVDRVQVEANKTTQSFAEELREELRKREYRCTITTKPAPNNKSKEVRIFERAPDIREHFLFRASGKREKSYELFMTNIFSFKILGKNKHDDAPDSMAMAADILDIRKNRVEIFQRPF